MTVYVSPTILWADSDVELHVAAAMAGLDPATYVTDSFPRFPITERQRLGLMAQGATVTDWLEPAFQQAAREGDYMRLAAFAEYRGKWATMARGWAAA